ncbi:MAG: hypothetical protein PGN34_05190 [Methylobacterium frigidaeris]
MWTTSRVAIEIEEIPGDVVLARIVAPADRPDPSGIRAVVEFRPVRVVTEPVAPARALRRFGYDLTQAHRIVTALAEGTSIRSEAILTIPPRVGEPRQKRA